MARATTPQYLVDTDDIVILFVKKFEDVLYTLMQDAFKILEE